MTNKNPVTLCLPHACHEEKLQPLPVVGRFPGDHSVMQEQVHVTENNNNNNNNDNNNNNNNNKNNHATVWGRIQRRSGKESQYCEVVYKRRTWLEAALE